MIVHPLLLGILAADLLVITLEGGAVLFAFQALLHWQPASASATQLRLEARAESADIAAGMAFRVFTAASILWVIALTQILPGIVPGAMCGTGVLQAVGPVGWQAIGLRIAAFFILYARQAAIRINQTHPQAPLTQWNARLQLFALPILVMAVTVSASAFFHLDVNRPVSCCAAVYDQFRSIEGARRLAGVSDGVLLVLFGCASGMLLAVVYRMQRLTHPGARSAAVLVAATLIWMPIAAITLVNVLSASIYQVLHHHCPWCLFLPEHHMMGFLLFGAWILVGGEAWVVKVAAGLGRKSDAVLRAAGERSRLAARRAALGVLIFCVVAGAPTLIWRIRFGVWL